MKNILAIAGWVTAAALTSACPALGADTAADAAQVKLQAISAADLRKSTAVAGGYKLSDIEVKSTAHQITITVINSKLNSGVAADRMGEVSKIGHHRERNTVDHVAGMPCHYRGAKNLVGAVGGIGVPGARSSKSYKRQRKNCFFKLDPYLPLSPGVGTAERTCSGDRMCVRRTPDARAWRVCADCPAMERARRRITISAKLFGRASHARPFSMPSQ